MGSIQLSDNQALTFILFMGIILLVWGIHGVINRRNYSKIHFQITLSQVAGGVTAILVAIIGFIKENLF